MAYDLEEQEQLDEFKAWWAKNGKMVSSLVLVVVLAYVGWQGYHYWIQKKSTEASNIYQTLVTTDATKLDAIKTQANQLTSEYIVTPYAGRAAVFLAKTQYEAKDVNGAKQQLQWAIEHAKESSVQAIAGLQLAGIHYENKDYESAKKVLNNIQDQGYLGLKDNLLGDVFLAEGKTEEAKKALTSALKNLDPQGRLFQLTKQKLESLGG
jgi:predicted negative regulator of RcsB-dependent stress response